MSPLPPGDTAAVDDTPAARPRPTLLTSGTGCDPIRGTNLGQAGYSYAFVARQFVRMLEADFDLRPGGALASGNPGENPPIAAHLGFRPPHEFELVPGVKNVLIPAWEFPEIPRAPWVTDPRQDWARTANACDLILQLCEFTREAFERGGVTVPMAVIPVPVAPEYFEVDDWRADREIVLETPALVLGGGGGWQRFRQARGGPARARPGRCERQRTLGTQRPDHLPAVRAATRAGLARTGCEGGAARGPAATRLDPSRAGAAG